jgi:RES domain-containing protein
MLVYRIARKDVVRDLSGTGAKLYGGRWNHRGTAVVYTSETRALATVEFLVHVSLSNAPSGLMTATIEIPDSIAPEDVSRGSLPRGWRDYPPPRQVADLGTQWAKSGKSLLLRVPSAVVEQEYNILINPLHSDMRHVKLQRVEPFEFDKRLVR